MPAPGLHTGAAHPRERAQAMDNPAGTNARALPENTQNPCGARLGRPGANIQSSAMENCNVCPSDTAPSTSAPIVVTGAGGFIGQHLVRQLLEAGYSVRAVTRNPAAFRVSPSSPKGSEARSSKAGTTPTGTGHDGSTEDWIRSQRLQVLAHPGVGPDADWQPVLAGARAVIHGAGIAHVPLDANRDSQRQLWRVNVRAPHRLARDAARAGVAQFIFLSSIKAAGEWSVPGHALREDDPPRPEDCYGFAKLVAERHLQRLKHGPVITILRPPLVYGPGVKANFAALQKLATSGLPLPLGSVDNQRSFLAIDNLCSAIMAILENPGRAAGLFHLSDGPALSTPALIRAMAQAAGKPARLLPVPPALLAGLARLAGKSGIWQRLAGSLAVDNQRFCQQLGWKPPVDASTALKRMQ